MFAFPRFGRVLPENINLLVEGNSISDQGPSITNWWEALQEDWPETTITKLAVSGQNIDDMISRLPTAEAAYNPYKDNILTAWEVGNQILASAMSTPREAVDKLWEYTEAASAIGYRVLVLTPPIRYVGPTGYEFPPELEEAIGYMQAEWTSTSAVGYLPIHQLDVLRRVRSVGSLYFTDSIHPNTLGLFYCKEYIKNFILNMSSENY